MTRLEAIERINALVEQGEAVTFRNDGTTYVIGEATTDGVLCYPKGYENDPYASLSLEWHELPHTPVQLMAKHTPAK